MSVKHGLFSVLLAGGMLASVAPPSDAAKQPIQLHLGATPVANVDGDTVDPLIDEKVLIAFLEGGLAGSGEPRLEASLDSATIERDGDEYFLIGRGKNDDGQCVTPSIRLEATSAAPMAAGIYFIRVETCLGRNCPACLAQRDGEGHIQFCYCMPAGECEKVILVIPIPIPF